MVKSYQGYAWWLLEKIMLQGQVVTGDALYAQRKVCKLEREVWRKGKKITQSKYLIISLAPEEGEAERLLSLRREHWGIENRLH